MVVIPKNDRSGERTVPGATVMLSAPRSNLARLFLAVVNVASSGIVMPARARTAGAFFGAIQASPETRRTIQSAAFAGEVAKRVARIPRAK
jgi:hypothetical protein